MYTQKSNHLRSHSRAIMALDHSRFKTWKTKHALNLRFRFRHVYFTKSCQQIWGCVNQPFLLFIHHSWGETVLFIYRPRTECSISQFFKTNCTQSIFRTTNSGLLAKPFRKFPEYPIRPAGSHFWQAPNLQWTLIELHFTIIKNLLLFFYLMVL